VFVCLFTCEQDDTKSYQAISRSFVGLRTAGVGRIDQIVGIDLTQNHRVAAISDFRYHVLHIIPVFIDIRQVSPAYIISSISAICNTRTPLGT